MKQAQNTDLLKDRKVVEEIRRHLWLESEKAGADIGFEQAAVDWLEKFSKAWIDYHMPSQKPGSSKNKTIRSLSKKTPAKKPRSKKHSFS